MYECFEITGSFRDRVVAPHAETAQNAGVLRVYPFRVGSDAHIVDGFAVEIFEHGVLRDDLFQLRRLGVDPGKIQFQERFGTLARSVIRSPEHQFTIPYEGASDSMKLVEKGGHRVIA